MLTESSNHVHRCVRDLSTDVHSDWFKKQKGKDFNHLITTLSKFDFYKLLNYQNIMTFYRKKEAIY